MTRSTTSSEPLAHQRLLLVVDNCEHVLEAAADVVERIVASARP